MPGDRINTLIKKLDRGLSKSLQFFNSLDPNQWDDPVSDDPDAWSVRQCLWHFIYSEKYLREIAQNIASGGPGVLDETVIDEFNKGEMGKLPHITNDELLDSLSASRSETINWVKSLDESTLDLQGGHPVM